jgi:hypothetical protein
MDRIVGERAENVKITRKTGGKGGLVPKDLQILNYYHRYALLGFAG